MQSGVPTISHHRCWEDHAMTDKPVVGVDVSKHWLDAAAHGGPIDRIENSRDAIIAWIEKTHPSLVAFEPTGGYERVLQRCLRERDILFARVHPNAVVAYRKSRGIRAKTDRIDARLIAAFAAEELSRRGLKPAIAADEALRELAARRRQLLQTIQAERCRLDLAETKAVRDSIGLVLDAMTRSLETLVAQIRAHLQSNSEAGELTKLLQSLRGIGPVVAMTLMADLPELGHLSSKQIAALVGLAPQTRQSGKSQQRARTGYGRPYVKQVLFNAARAAIRHPSPFKAFYDRLVTENKRPGKVALTAVMRKLLVTANAIARDRKPWAAAA
jgi:transposase